jgi:hypothetical protein
MARGFWAVLAIVLLGTLNMAWGIQSVASGSPVPTPDWTATIEHLTLNGALICAVVTLWKQLSKKDDLLVASVKTVTESLAATAAANVELRAIINESVAAKRLLAAAVEKLEVSIGELPCTVGVHRGKGQE